MNTKPDVDRRESRQPAQSEYKYPNKVLGGMVDGDERYTKQRCIVFLR